MSDEFFHPLTGAFIEGTLGTLSAAVDDTYAEIERLKAAVGPLQERRAELRGPVSLPKRRYQTAKQQQICGSCGKPSEPSA